MNARQQLKPKTIRLAILLALADGAITTIDDLQTKIDEPRGKVANAVYPAANEGLIKRLRDDVTSLPAYQISAKGREHLASFGGVQKEVAVTPRTAEDSNAVEPAGEAVRQHQKVLDAIAANNAPEQPAITPCVKSDIPDRSEPTVSAIIGAMAFGYQGSNEPPAGHWLSEFHQRGAVDAQKDAEIARTSRAKDILVIERDEQAVRIDEQQAEIDRLADELAAARATLELSRLAHASPAPVGYVVKRPDSPLMRFTKHESARARALSAARAGKHAQVFALIPAGVAKPGAEWVEA